MTRTLLLLRHGKSDWGVGAVNDYARPLKQRGRKAARRIGIWLRSHDFLSPLIVSSGAARARATAELVAEQLGLAPTLVQFDDRVYEAAPDTLLEICRQSQSRTRTLMLVGHNPGLEMLCERLSAQPLASASNGKLLPTAALAVLPLRHDWADLDTGVSEGAYVVRPRELSEAT
jgi:phosphohistidine phosphatase